MKYKILYYKCNNFSRFLDIIKNGIPEYNVRFNPTKIQSNIEMPYTSGIIEFLGWKILLNQIR